MKKSIYVENTTRQINRQMKWANIDNAEDRNEFLNIIIEYCQKMKEKPFKLQKSSKTRHG